MASRFKIEADPENYMKRRNWG